MFECNADGFTEENSVYLSNDVKSVIVHEFDFKDQCGVQDGQDRHLVHDEDQNETLIE